MLSLISNDNDVFLENDASILAKKNGHRFDQGRSQGGRGDPPPLFSALDTSHRST